MKKTYLTMMSIVLTALLIVSCTTETEEKEVMTADSPEPQEQKLETEQIPAAEALPMIWAYQPLQESLMPCADNNASKVPQFIHIPSDELQGMINALGNDPYMLYASMVEKKGETAIVFAGKSTEESEWAYFDFTTPCPPTCDTLGIAGGN